MKGTGVAQKLQKRAHGLASKTSSSSAALGVLLFAGPCLRAPRSSADAACGRTASRRSDAGEHKWTHESLDRRFGGGASVTAENS